MLHTNPTVCRSQMGDEKNTENLEDVNGEESRYAPYESLKDVEDGGWADDDPTNQVDPGGH